MTLLRAGDLMIREDGSIRLVLAVGEDLVRIVNPVNWKSWYAPNQRDGWEKRGWTIIGAEDARG